MFTTTRSSTPNSLRWMRRIMTMLLIVSNFASVMLADAAPAQQDSQPSFPIRAAFYYPWFPETWGHGTNYAPTLGRYNSSDPAVIRAHIDAMQYGKIAAGIASWWLSR